MTTVNPIPPVMRLWPIIVFLFGLISARAEKLPDVNVDTVVFKLLGKHSGLIAKGTCQQQQRDDPKPISIPMDFMLSEGRMRIEIDLGAAKEEGSLFDSTGRLKKSGMNRLVKIVRADTGKTLAIFASWNCYVEIPAASIYTDLLDTNKYTLTGVAAGKDSVNGRVCNKSRLLLADKSGGRLSINAWYAPDLGHLPVQIQALSSSIDTVTFDQVKTSKIEAAMFEPPPGAKRYNTIMEMLAEEIKRHRK